ncbi:MAG: Rieske 2Fe-2S domain-containing protein [Thermomonas sp.]
MSSSLNGNDGTNTHASLLRVDSLAVDSLYEVEAVLDGDAESLIVHRDAAGDLRAWLNVCPHAGRRLDWAPGQFLRSKEGLLVCAVHGASFDLANGQCVAGPCRGEHLREIAVRCVDGELRLGACPPTTAPLSTSN